MFALVLVQMVPRMQRLVPASKEHLKVINFLLAFGGKINLLFQTTWYYRFVIIYLPFSLFVSPPPRIFRGKLLALTFPLVRGCPIRSSEEIQKL